MTGNVLQDVCLPLTCQLLDDKVSKSPEHYCIVSKCTL